MNTIIIAEFVLYLLAMIAIGLYFSRKKMTVAEFHLGGKKLPGWALALSERATGESAWCLLGLTGFAFSTGLSSIWIAVGCVSGIAISWLWLAAKFRIERDRYNVLTMSDYFATKFSKQGGAIRWLSSIIIIVFFVLYVAAQFSGSGKTLQMTFGISPMIGIILTAAVVIFYSMAGGFFSVVWTDVVQGILMIITLVITPIVALWKILAGNYSISAALASAGSGMDSFTGTSIGLAAGILIFNNLAWIFGYMGGQPQLSSRFMAMRSDKDVKAGAKLAIGWTILAYSGAILIGLCALTLYGTNVVTDAESILPYMLLDLMPPWLAGLLLTGAVAAMMSTANSQLLVATSSISEDIFHKALGKNVGEHSLIMVSRVTMLAVGALALLLAFTSKSLIYTIVGWAWAGIGCTFSPIVILSFFWRRLTGIGVVSALAIGLIFTILWMTTGMDAIITSRAATFFVVLLTAIIVSLLTKK